MRMNLERVETVPKRSLGTGVLGFFPAKKRLAGAARIPYKKNRYVHSSD
jgi:hypothetical protein